VNEEETLHYCLDLVEKTSDYAAASSLTANSCYSICA
jgi:hypothetical protein